MNRKSIGFVVVALLVLAALEGFGADKYLITTVAGNGEKSNAGDVGPATQTALGIDGSDVTDMCIDSQGNLYFVERADWGKDRNLWGQAGRVRKIDTSGIITTVAGNGKVGYSGEGGPATEAAIQQPTSVRVDAAGNLYIASWYGDHLWKVDTKGIITTIGGEGVTWNYIWAEQQMDMLPRAFKVRLDGAGNIYLFCWGWIQKIDAAGNKTRLDTRLKAEDVAFDKDGNLYACLTENHQVVRVDLSSGKTTTIVGTGAMTKPGVYEKGDGGPALSATLKYPIGIDFDSAGNLYIADTGNGVIRMVDKSGIITTIAGGGFYRPASSDGGPATDAKTSAPVCVRADSAGNVFFCHASGVGGNDGLQWASGGWIRKLYR
jgi:sugar lactone lactonase YvrE